MYRFFILILIGSLALPAVPVSGCECKQNQTSKSNSCCCGTKSEASQSGKQKSCCCKNLPKEKQHNETSQSKQLQCQKKNCHCQQTFSQQATTIPVKSVELAQQLRCNWDIIDLTAQLSPALSPATADSHELNSEELSLTTGEFCAQICLWLI